TGSCCHDEPRWLNSTENRGRLAAHPAHELLDFDSIEAAHNSSAAEPKHGDALTVEVFPFASGRRIGVHRPVLELDAHLAQELGHRGRLGSYVGTQPHGVRA